MSPSLVRVHAAATEPDKAQPDWTGESVLSRIVNWMIETKPIYGIMKLGAMNAMKSTTQKAGIDWDGHVRRMAATPELQQLQQEFEQQPRPNLAYPDYYTVPFHAYDEGNLNWQAAYEVEPASYAMALRTFKTESLTGEAAMTKLREGINREILAYHARNSLPAPQTILDIGCSTGISTRWYQRAYPDADFTGLDLSPYFLAVAELEERHREASGSPAPKRIKFLRGLAEATDFEDAAFDLVVFSFVIHECPQAAIRSFIKEAARIVKPGGVLCFVDNNPRSKTIQNLPPVIFSLMKSTEPWSDEYYSYDLEAGMRGAGFGDVLTTEADHRHRVVCGVAPAQRKV